MPQVGRPAMKARVPSIGSSTQTYSASSLLGAEFLADDAVGREAALDELAHGRFARPVGLGDRVERAAAGLVVRGDGGAEERQDRLAGQGRELVDELREVDEPP